MLLHHLPSRLGCKLSFTANYIQSLSVKSLMKTGHPDTHFMSLCIFEDTFLKKKKKNLERISIHLQDLGRTIELF